MTKEELLIRALTYDSPPRLPVDVWIHPAAWRKRPREIRDLVAAHQSLFPNTKDLLAEDYDPFEHMPPSYHAGTFTDEWGCVWTNVEAGMEAVVTGHPIPRREDIASLQIPSQRNGHIPHGFLYLRLLDLRGFEEAMLDFAEECDELQQLIDKVTEYNLRQLDVILGKNPGPVIVFGDDLGTQRGLAIGPERWRKYLKPAYKKLYQRVRDTGRYVYMHSDGDITEIMADLAEIGVNMINPQIRANGLDNLARICKGKIPVMLDLDRQLFPFATPAELKEHVRTCVETLYLPEGGLGLCLEMGMDVPTENMAALLGAVEEYRDYRPS
ncbi:MAG: hypothetical protein FWD25_09370 [Clostridia bacterium]|nr:hypothetical protein [Clostridia bacterium]